MYGQWLVLPLTGESASSKTFTDSVHGPRMHFEESRGDVRVKEAGANVPREFLLCLSAVGV